MKSFTNYINNDFETTLEEHFFVEYAIKESLNYSIYKILEKYGSYNGQINLVYFLAKHIYKSYKSEYVFHKNDLNDFPNIFFDKLIISISENDNGYLVNKSTFNKESKLFDKVVINLYDKEINDYHYIVETLVHELLHAYNEYQSYLSNSKIKIKELIDKDTYKKTIFSIYNGSEFPKFVCKKILNVLKKFEQNAYLSELNVVKFSSYKEAYQSFKQSPIWIMYLSLWNYLIELNTNGTIKDKELLKNEYNEINNSEKSFDYIFKKLNSQFIKVFRKIEKTIPKIVYKKYEEYLNNKILEGIVDNRHKSLIELLNYK